MYLNCHTHYSFRFGTFSEEVLLQMAAHYGAQAIALTDINNTSACLNFIRIAPKYHIRPILGIDFRIGAKQLFVGIAHNNDGFLELNDFLSHYAHEKKELPSNAPSFEHVSVIYPFEQVLQLDKLEFQPHEYIGVSTKDVRKIRFSRLFQHQDRFVILQPVTFRNKKDYNAHRLLRAIDNNTLLSKLDRDQEAQPWEVMMPVEKLKEVFTDFPFIIRNTEKLIEESSIFFDFSEQQIPQNQKTYTGSFVKDAKLMRKLCFDHLPYRYPVVTDDIQSRLEKELNLIQEKDFVSYFLINWDIVNYARSRGYYYVGRGSGANSIVAYLLRITDVDPIELDLYFERFINLYRTTPPDFDIDFSWKDREDVTQYIFDRFQHVALLAAYNTFKHSATVRELGKVFGLPKHEIDVLSDGRFHYNKLDQLSKLVLNYGELIKGMPNYLSIHAAGILISEKPIHYFSATDLPPKGFPTVQFDMVVAEDIGLYKFDILGQRGLAKIKDALEVVKQNHPDDPVIDIHDIKRFKTDEKVNSLVRNAKCLGCFYVESPAMRMLLKKLEVDNYLGLVAASSIIRPGVAKSGMMREYILRHRYPEKRKEAHPVMWDLMEDTYGVMVYQEDVIKVAHHFAGLTLGEADVLRRGMSGKYRSREEFHKVKMKFISNCREKGYSDELTFEVWRQIESFAGYAFAKGHSASYAVESYQSLFLKTYYPLEYMVATINNGGGFYRSEIYFHEAMMLGATIHAPCINQSEALTMIRGKDIYIGLGRLKDLEVRVITLVLTDRNQNGPFQSFNDFLERVPISIEQLSILIRIDAFRFTEVNKRNLLWKAHYLLGFSKRQYEQKQFFRVQTKEHELPKLYSTQLEDTFDQMELIGFPLTNPFQLLKEPIDTPFLVKEFRNCIGREVTVVGYLVTVKNTSTSKQQRMHFGTFLDYEGHFIDTVHFPDVASRFPFRGKGIYQITGKVVDEFGFLSLEVSFLKKLDYISDPRYADTGQLNEVTMR